MNTVVNGIKRTPLTIKRLEFVLNNIGTLTYKKMSEDLGVSTHSIRKYVDMLRKEGILPAEHVTVTRSRSADERLNIKDNSQDSLNKIIDTLKIGRPAARKHLNKLTGQTLYDPKTTKSRRDSVVTLHSSGLSISDIASELKVTPALIRADLVVMGLLPCSGDAEMGLRIHNLVMIGFSVKTASIGCGISSTKGWLIYKALRLDDPTIENEYNTYRKNVIQGEDGRVSKKVMSPVDIQVGNLVDHFTVPEICERLKLSETLVNNSLKKLMYRCVIVYDNKKRTYRSLVPAIVESFQDGDDIDNGCIRLGVSVTRYKDIVRKNILDGAIKIECGIGVVERRKMMVKLREVCSLDTIAAVMGISAATVKRVLTVSERRN